MEKDKVRQVLGYYADIQGQKRLLMEDRAAVEAEYSGLKAMEMDGMPHSHAPGKPTEVLGIAAAEKNMAQRLREIDRKLTEMDADRATIRAALDGLCARYKKLLTRRHLCKDSWGRISALEGVPESTARHRYGKALDRLGEILDEVDGIETILWRASRARV